MPSILYDKSSLRQASRTMRAGISSQERDIWSALIQQNLRALLQGSLSKPSIIAGYCAIRDELDIMPALAALSPRHTIALPVLPPADNIMHFCRYRMGDALIPGRYDIPEPPPPLETLTPDVIVAPMLAFDKRFHRLGYGAGYYDRAIAEFRTYHHSLIVVGVAFSLQEIPSVGALEYDQMLDWIVTEKGVTVRG